PGCPVVSVSPSTAPTAYRNVAYSQTFTASNGNAPYVFSLVSGTLPPGLSFTNAGVLSGTPTTLGSYTFTIKATDVYNCESDLLPITMAVKTL
ncbi:putative Ig domain-containing protein, partial [Streptomyces caeruleatus]